MTKQKDRRDLYFEYLVNRLNPDEEFKKNYSCMLSYLYGKAFTYTLPLDENLAINGIGIRKAYISEEDLLEDAIVGDCSMLEMMLALGEACDYTVKHPADDLDAFKWFKLMLESMRLLPFSNKYFNATAVNSIIDTCLNRTFDQNGEGSFFSIKENRDEHDFREMTIWTQFLTYLRHNQPSE